MDYGFRLGHLWFSAYIDFHIISLGISIAFPPVPVIVADLLFVSLSVSWA